MNNRRREGAKRPTGRSRPDFAAAGKDSRDPRHEPVYGGPN